MRILITNDDGILAEGILSLASEVSKRHEVVVVAPVSEQSGVSHAFTYKTPLSAKKVVLSDLKHVECYAVNGTPVDCVKLGAFNLMDSPPDMVLSGINHGPNLGSDVHYSGTASAALEGAILGLQSIAFSLALSGAAQYQTAALCAVSLIDYVLQHPLPLHTMLNVNVPDLPIAQIKGIAATNLSFQEYEKRYQMFLDPRGETHYWTPSGVCEYPSNETDSDDKWIKQGYVTVTPVKVDLTDRSHLQEMKRHPFFQQTCFKDI